MQLMMTIAEKLQDLGARPCPQAVEQAKEALAVIDAHLSSQIDSVSLCFDNIDGRPQSLEIARLQDASEKEKLPYKTILWLDQLYESYEAMMTTNKCEPNVQAGSNDEQAKDVLNLSGIQLTRLVDDSSKLSSLVALDLSRNNLEALPDYFDNLTMLRVLNVSGNMLKFLPDSIGRCSSLLELDASFNQLEYLASNFGSNLPNLQRLYLQLNKLNALPSSIPTLTSLVHLEVQFNKLVTLPLNIGNLKKLQKLNASGNFNNLTSLPDSIGYASALVNLDLSYNQITKLPLSFGKLTQLKELKLLQNPLVVPPIEVVEHSTKAVVEYMSEQLRISLEARTTTTTIVNETSSSSGRRSKCVSSSSSRRLPVRSTWLLEFLGTMCNSTSFVLGGSSRVKFVDLRNERSSSDSD